MVTAGRIISGQVTGSVLDPVRNHGFYTISAGGGESGGAGEGATAALTRGRPHAGYAAVRGFCPQELKHCFNGDRAQTVLRGTLSSIR